MKHLYFTAFMIFMSTAYADIEYDGNDGNPTEGEIQKSRACFDELSKNGCGDPGVNLKEFRVCMHDVFDKLGTDCQKMMTTLYKKKD